MLNNIKEHGGELICEQEYKNNKTHVRVKCKYGHEWNVRPDQLTQGTWCSICNESHGEREIRLYLEKHNIWYLREWIPEGFKYRYDFLIYHNNAYKLIEYDGEQHFRYVQHFHKTLDKYHDRVKEGL